MRLVNAKAWSVMLTSLILLLLLLILWGRRGSWQLLLIAWVVPRLLLLLRAVSVVCLWLCELSLEEWGWIIVAAWEVLEIGNSRATLREGRACIGINSWFQRLMRGLKVRSAGLKTLRFFLELFVEKILTHRLYLWLYKMVSKSKFCPI